MTARDICGDASIRSYETPPLRHRPTIAAMGKSASQKIAASERKARVGENIVLARESLGMTQAEFARQYHMASNLLNQWEAGLYYPDPIFLMQLCDDYGFTMDWFYRGILAGVSSERAAGLRRVSVEKPEA